MRKLLFVLMIPLWVSFAACESRDYDDGDGSLSYLRAEFGEAHSGEAKTLVSLVTDNQQTVSFSHPYPVSWATTADSLYRALVYFNDRPPMKGGVEVVAAARVSVLYPKSISQVREMKTDPMVFSSSWMSQNGRYANIELGLMVGATDDEKALHMLGVVATDTVLCDDGTRQYCMTIFHSQNGVPEYYTSRHYASIPTSGMSDGDEIHLTIATYEGNREVTFKVKQP